MKSSTRTIGSILLATLITCVPALQAALAIERCWIDRGFSVSSNPQPGCSNVPSKLQPGAMDSNQRTEGAFRRLPLSFESHYERGDPQMGFVARGNGYNVYLTSKETTLEFPHPPRKSVCNELDPANAKRQVSRVRFSLVGANGGARAIALNELPGKSNYFSGSDPKRWRRNISTWLGR